MPFVVPSLARLLPQPEACLQPHLTEELEACQEHSQCRADQLPLLLPSFALPQHHRRPASAPPQQLPVLAVLQLFHRLSLALRLLLPTLALSRHQQVTLVLSASGVPQYPPAFVLPPYLLQLCSHFALLQLHHLPLVVHALADPQDLPAFALHQRLRRLYSCFGSSGQHRCASPRSPLARPLAPQSLPCHGLGQQHCCRPSSPRSPAGQQGLLVPEKQLVQHNLYYLRPLTRFEQSFPCHGLDQ
mmetsp:Transcript_96755/g.171036  ORF Transcript_96755/g.171036 Transcript_96755/m.171036 type:complete len:244 (+) Transcript_96755:71-802(+)